MARMGAAAAARWVALLCLLCFLRDAQAFKAPFRPADVLPLLPHSIAWPTLNKLSKPVDLLPMFVGSVSSEANTTHWKGSCFYENEAYMEFVEPSNSNESGGGILHLKTSNAHSWTCIDIYVFATPFRVTWDYYFTARQHTLVIKEWEPGELEYVKNKGFSVFLMPAGMMGTLLALWDVLPIFSNSGWGENSNIAFLERHMATKIVKRSQPWTTNVTVDEIQSGDFLALSKLRGRWGGFETLEKWVTGAYAGHTAVCLKDDEDNLFVAESGHENEKGEEVIAVIPWQEWWDFQMADVADPHVTLLPLHSDLRAKWNNTAAWEYAKEMDGKPYGYHNMIFAWIDTKTDNYPPPIDANLVASFITMWTRMSPDYASNMWNEALNKRLGTEGLDLPGIITETEKRGVPFEELLAMPEQDDWEYSDGKSTTCVAFILGMYKNAGVLGPLAESIQVTEFTIRDAYMLKVFEDDESQLPSWCNNPLDSPLPYCQILGSYLMELPEFNTIVPYAQMDETCPTVPPTYYRPSYC